MIRFLFKGLLRDRSRSLLPIIIIAIGVMLTVMLSGYMKGAFGDIVSQNANFDTGHVKVMTKAYAENKEQLPNDLSIMEVSKLKQSLSTSFPDMQWTERTKFGGLIDVPDENGETKSQGPSSGMALDLFSPDSKEIERMKIESSLVEGSVPTKPGEAILGYMFADKLGLKLGEKFTFFGTTMEGSMTFYTFKLIGKVRFGMPMMDKGSIIIDITDAQKLLDMEDGTGELLGFLNKGVYDHDIVQSHADQFNQQYINDEDEYAPIMLPLKSQNDLGSLLDYANVMSSFFIMIFIIAMSVVLWNTGLLGGLRRYKEFGIRLALGESKANIYKTLIAEAILVGLIGSILGTIIGVGISYYIQIVGIDISAYMENSTMIMPSVIRSKVTPSLYFIGFIPGVLAMVFGTMLAGIGIYKRETANLFKELEV